MPKMRFHARGGETGPRLGQWMKSPRGRNAYRVVGIKPGRAGLGGGRSFALELEKYPAVSIPEGEEVFSFVWFSRRKQQRRQ